MAFNENPNRLESAFAQRDTTNTYYEQVNISGSDLIIYHSSSGELTADKISVWAAQYGLGGGGGPCISASWASRSLSSSFVDFNGNRPITRTGYIGLNVGGLDVVNFLNNFFFPFVPATVGISGGSNTWETGSVHSVTLVSTITANQETSYGTASIFRDSALWNTNMTIPPLSFTYTDTNISSSHIYLTNVQVDNNGSPTIIASTSQTSAFIYPYLWGTSTIAGLSGTALYNAFTRQVVGQSNKTISMVGNVVYMYFAYPAIYADLSSIKDPNLFEIKGLFDYSASVPVTSSGLTYNWQANYKVYRTTLVSDPNGNYQFIY